MSAKPTQDTHTNLSVDDFEAALTLLSAEARFKPLDRRKAVITSISDIAVWLVIFGVAHGLMMLTFNVKWGLIILGAATVAFFITGAAASSPDEVSNITKTIRRSIADSKINQAAGVGWQKRELSPFLFLPIAFLFPLTLVGLGYGSYVHSTTIVLVSLIVGLLCSLAIGVYYAIDEYREFQYFSLVATLGQKFQSRLSGLGSQKNVAISSKEKELLSQIEQEHVNRNVAKALEKYDETKEFYSIALRPSVLEYLGELPENKRNSVREVIDTLQITPRPQNARLVGLREGVAESPTEYQLRIGDQRLTYAVNDEKLRVDVIGIGSGNKGGNDAS